MKRAIFSALALSIATIACASERDVCGDVAKGLAKCGVVLQSDLACNNVDKATTEALAERLDSQGCEAIAANADGAVDKRVCDLGGFTCPESPTPAPSGKVPQYPVVFVSGIDATPTFDWNPRILNALRASGVETHHVKVSPWASTGDRAADLWGALEGLLARGATKVNLVCYAVGGIDCRFLASPSGLFGDDRATYAKVNAAIASVTTIATPHRGTRVADAALEALRSSTASDILAALGAPDALPPSDGALASVIEGLTVDAMTDFDARVLDGDGIHYQSFAGVSNVLGRASSSSDRDVLAKCGTIYRHDGTHDAMNELLWVTAPFAGGASDGMIAIESAKHGDFRGCIPADHYDVIGQIGHVTRDVSTGFDDVRFYAFVASDLAEQGF